MKRGTTESVALSQVHLIPSSLCRGLFEFRRRSDLAGGFQRDEFVL